MFYNAHAADIASANGSNPARLLGSLRALLLRLLP